MATKVFDTAECAWSHVRLNILGRPVTGLRGFNVNKDFDKELLYGSGDEPIDISTGNKKYDGSIKLLKYEVDLLNDAALLAGYEDITEVPHTLINVVVEFKKSLTSKTRTIVVPAMGFTKLDFNMQQGAKMMEIDLPFLAMGIILK